ncbi:hypothetical protein O181_027077 [Austropuccinia psidii MF-1]|uniref:Uncharacterized protein n=1 Tax=Austropuccinia psidii MF-1 TaxID=1389203 RepID=A0A9Q3H1C6_9BASI|nr:hypothetical protein [Austropuccinia psidii MF-1]
MKIVRYRGRDAKLRPKRRRGSESISKVTRVGCLNVSNPTEPTGDEAGETRDQIGVCTAGPAESTDGNTE